MMSLGVSLSLIVLLLAGYAMFTSIPSSVPPTEWSAKYGGTGIEYASFIEQTSDGGYIVVGSVVSELEGVYQSDVWFVKTDSMGNVQWSKTYGGNWNDNGICVRQTVDGGYAVAGITNSIGAGEGDFWLIKTDPNGNMQWNHTYGGTSYDFARYVQQTNDGGYILAGETGSFGAGRSDCWLVRTDSAGNMLWNRTYGGPNFEAAVSVCQTSDDGYFITGRILYYDVYRTDFLLIKTDPIGNMQWNKTYGGSEDDDANAGQQTSDGGYVVAGMTFSYGAGQGDFWLVKTDSNGNLQWNRTYGGPNLEIGYYAEQTSDGGFIIAGRTYDPYLPECLVVKTYPNGTMQWEKWIREQGDPDPEARAFCIRQTSDKGYIMAGSAFSPIPNTNYRALDFWVEKLSATYSAVPVAIFALSGLIVCLALFAFFASIDQVIRERETSASRNTQRTELLVHDAK